MAAAVLAAPLRTNLTLQVLNYPANELSTNLVFKVYSTTNINLSVTNWPLYRTVVATNSQISLPIDANQRFFVLTSSNWWGESSFSNVAGTPPLPRSDASIRLGP
jgi:hypothetical protein